LSRASLYRSRKASSTALQIERVRAPSPRRLNQVERRLLLDTLHLPEFVDQPPTEVYAALLVRGIYIASIRTMYRVLAEVGETRERRNQRPAQSHTKPSLTATAPNPVWTWDITKLATLQKGVFLMAYVIIDLFSRYVVGWMVASKECQHLAAQLFAETIARHGIEPGLQVHADRGSAMKSDMLAQLLASLDATRSSSRPRVCERQCLQPSAVQDAQIPAGLSRALHLPSGRLGVPAVAFELAGKMALPTAASAAPRLRSVATLLPLVDCLCRHARTPQLMASSSVTAPWRRAVPRRNARGTMRHRSRAWAHRAGSNSQCGFRPRSRSAVR
jgi:hypothetical protein